MTTTATAKFGLAFLTSGQLQPEVTVNGDMIAIDTLTQLSVISNSVTTPPASPADGATYIIPSGATGAWASNTNNIAVWVANNNAWSIYVPKVGWLGYVQSISSKVVYNGTAWVSDAAWLTGSGVPAGSLGSVGNFYLDTSGTGNYYQKTASSTWTLLGSLLGAPAYTTTTASFTQPASGSNVNVSVGNTAWMDPGSVLYVEGGGYYSISSVTSGTVVVLTNLGYVGNATSGATVSSGELISPSGQQGVNAYSTVSASFTQPASGSTVTASVSSTLWMAVGQVVYIATGGYYSVQTIGSASSVTLQNLGYPGNAGSGATINNGSVCSPGGLQGVTGQAAYTTTTSNFTQPAIGSTVSASVQNTAWMSAGAVLYIASGGYYSVSSITSSTVVVLTNLGYPGNASASSTITSGSGVTAAGLQGPGAYTVTTANFTQPNSGSTVAVSVASTAWMAAAQVLYVAGGGYYSVSSIGGSTSVTLTNLGYAGNAASAATINSGAAVVAGGIIGQQGTSLNRPTTTLTSVSGVFPQIDLSLGYEVYEITLHENATWPSPIFINQAAGVTSDISLEVKQASSGTAWTCASPGTGETGGGTWVNSSALSALELLGLRARSNAVIFMTATGVGS